MKIKGSVLRTASTGRLRRQELPYGILLHRLFPSQKISRIQNRVTSLYESELTVTLSGTTVTGCKLQDVSGSEMPGSAPPCVLAGTLTATAGGLRCLRSSGLAAAEHKVWDRLEVCAASLLLSLLHDRRGRGRRGQIFGKAFLGPEAGNSANAKFFCSGVFFLLAGWQVEDHITWKNIDTISPWGRESSWPSYAA